MLRKSVIPAILGVTMATPFAELLEVPYAGGKIAGTVDVTVNAGPKMSPDSIRFGGHAGGMIRLAFQAPEILAVCGAKPTIVAQFHGVAAAVWQTPDTSTDWNALTWMHPQRNDLPMIDGWESMGSSTSHRAQGFPLFSAGERITCMGEEYFMAPRWNRVVFMHFGSMRDFRGRFSFQVKHDTSYAPALSLQYHVLKRLTLHYVIAEESNDVSGAPVSLRRPDSRVTRVPQDTKDWRTVNLYSPLGVKLNREPGRFEAVVPARR